MEYFTRFPNKVFDYIINTDMTATQLKIVLAVCRNSYGWGKKYCDLSLTRLAKETNCSRRQVVRDVRILIEKDILSENYEERKRLLQFNESVTET